MTPPNFDVVTDNHLGRGFGKKKHIVFHSQLEHLHLIPSLCYNMCYNTHIIYIYICSIIYKLFIEHVEFTQLFRKWSLVFLNLLRVATICVRTFRTIGSIDTAWPQWRKSPSDTKVEQSLGIPSKLKWWTLDYLRVNTGNAREFAWIISLLRVFFLLSAWWIIRIQPEWWSESQAGEGIMAQQESAINLVIFRAIQSPYAARFF